MVFTEFGNCYGNQGVEFSSTCQNSPPVIKSIKLRFFAAVGESTMITPSSATKITPSPRRSNIRRQKWRCQRRHGGAFGSSRRLFKIYGALIGRPARPPDLRRHRRRPTFSSSRGLASAPGFIDRVPCRSNPRQLLQFLGTSSRSQSLQAAWKGRMYAPAGLASQQIIPFGSGSRSPVQHSKPAATADHETTYVPGT